MTNFEYTVILVAADKNLVKEMNNFGEQGWDIYSVLEGGKSAAGQAWICFAKKEKN